MVDVSSSANLITHQQDQPSALPAYHPNSSSRCKRGCGHG